jgi:subfamily B ATP-binding cassette protein MsbA
MKTFFRIFNYAERLSFFLPQYVIFTFLAVIFSAFNLALLIPLMRVLFGQLDETLESAGATPPEFSLDLIDWLTESFQYHFANVIIENGRENALLFVCFVVVISVFLANIFRYFAALIASYIRLDTVKNLRMHIFDRISALHIGYFNTERKGDMISRITNDVNEVEVSILSGFKVFFKEPLTIIVFFLMLFKISFELTIFTLTVLPISGGIMAEIIKRLKKRARQSQESLGRIVNILDETLGGMRVVKAFNARRYVVKKVDEETDFYRHVNLSYSRKRELASPLSEALGVTIVAIILFYGGSLVLNDQSDLDPSAFIAYLAVFSQIISPAKTFSTGITGLQKGLVSAERIFAVIDLQPTIKDKPGAVKIKEFKHKIVFDNVHFSYATEPVLKNIKLEIPKGKMVALVGPSGGGKSTLADLLPRFYDPLQGKVTIDGMDLRDIDLFSLRALMGIVTQESILFNDTISNNIAFGIENVDRESVIKAAKIANAHDFIVELENGYDTSIGERGSKLSGGQRQRISIARAVLKNPSILILDEATSALDSESEKLVQEALQNLMQNRTALVIAHRLSTIQHADEIVVIQNGEIFERGTHEELLIREGMYKKLQSIQNT